MGSKDKKYSKMQLRGGSRESGFKEPYKSIYIYLSIDHYTRFLEGVIWQLTVSAPSAR